MTTGESESLPATTCGITTCHTLQEVDPLLPPPPSAFTRNEKKIQGNQKDETMRGYRSLQRKYTWDQILENELCPYSKAESLIHRAEALLILDIVLNGP